MPRTHAEKFVWVTVLYGVVYPIVMLTVLREWLSQPPIVLLLALFILGYVVFVMLTAQLAPIGSLNRSPSLDTGWVMGIIGALGGSCIPSVSMGGS